MKTDPHADAVLRAALPEVLFAPDLALAMVLPIPVAEAAARRGSFGPPFYVTGRVAVLREHFLEALARRANASEQDLKEVLSSQRGPFNGL